MARLMGCDISQVRKDPVKYAKSLSDAANSVVILKGSTTIIAQPKGGITFNTTGNPGMATAGSGDCLTGIVATLIAMGNDIYDAACIGACLHGAAGDKAKVLCGEYSMTAMDIIDSLHLFST
ncbi:MAG TPA: NAD(P)H-hydrate dehydratase, partial [Clostridia bacterium]|nr:NAD(P)H-hydrate dehydratase [Clostridia bacterium]